MVSTTQGITAAILPFGRNHTIRVQFRFSKTLAAVIGDRCDIYEGSGDDFGSVMLHFHETGQHRIYRVKTETKVHLRFPVPPCAPSGWELGHEPCRIQWRDKERLIVWFPLEAWADSIAQVKT